MTCNLVQHRMFFITSFWDVTTNNVTFTQLEVGTSGHVVDSRNDMKSSQVGHFGSNSIVPH